MTDKEWEDFEIFNNCAKNAFRLPVDLARLHNLKELFANAGDAGFANPEVIGFGKLTIALQRI